MVHRPDQLGPLPLHGDLRQALHDAAAEAFAASPRTKIDLLEKKRHFAVAGPENRRIDGITKDFARHLDNQRFKARLAVEALSQPANQLIMSTGRRLAIGRASCRERV